MNLKEAVERWPLLSEIRVEGWPGLRVVVGFDDWGTQGLVVGHRPADRSGRLVWSSASEIVGPYRGETLEVGGWWEYRFSVDEGWVVVGRYDRGNHVHSFALSPDQAVEFAGMLVRAADAARGEQ